MKAPLKAGVLVFVGLGLASALAFASTAPTHAESQTPAPTSTQEVTAAPKAEQPQQPAANEQQRNVTPLEITPVCSDAVTHQAFWKVVNKNDFIVNVAWNNAMANVNGSYAAQANENSSKQFATYYNGADPNNTTTFKYEGQAQTSTNATVTPCEPVVIPPVEPTCIDGTDASNFIAEINQNRSPLAAAVLVTKNKLPVCEDVTLYFSSYIMPDNYDGRGFYPTPGVVNPTAIPQTLFASTKLVIKKGENAGIVTVNLPSDVCKNVQVDLYYAPEITEVGANGHGTQNILSQIFQAATGCGQNGGGNGGNGNGGSGNGGNGNAGGGVTAPVTPTTPVVATPVASPVTSQLPAELPHTGPTANYNALLLALALGFVTYAALYAFVPRRDIEV